MAFSVYRYPVAEKFLAITGEFLYADESVFRRDHG